MKQHLTKKIRRCRGMAVVEASLLFPLLLILTLGALEYGWMFVEQERILNACRQAARTAATANATQFGVITELTTLLNQDPSLARSRYTYTVSNVAVATGQPVTVNVSVNYANLQINSPNITELFPVPEAIGDSVTMIKEGP